MNSCCFLIQPIKMQMVVPKITTVYAPDVPIIQHAVLVHVSSCLSEFILLHNLPYENYLFLK